MLGEKRLDCQEMFCHACAFCECADMAMKEYCHKSASIELYVVPAFVNSAFACEVFLKALLKYFDISYKNEHKLKALFEMLPMDLSCLIYLQVYSHCGKGWNMETLENLSDAFVRHRYIYEVDRRKTPIINYDTYSMTVFRDILREACCEIFFGITWEIYKNTA